jgi:hypothetical protein
MIEECARHLGHADLLRERVDGPPASSACRPATVISHREMIMT